MRFSLITSFLFLTTALHALLKQKYVYGVGFLLLTVSSIFYRTVQTEWIPPVLFIDRLFILLVISVGFAYFLPVPFNKKLLPLFFFVTVFCIYGVSYLKKTFFFDTDISVSDRYQAAVHCLSVAGHHCILVNLV